MGTRLDVAACGLEGKILTIGYAGAEVPRRGHTVISEALTEDGSQILRLAVDTSGVLTVDIPARHEETIQTTTLVAPNPNGCDLSDFGLTGYAVESRWQFYRGDGATPNDAGGQAFADAMWRAAQNITSAESPCDTADGVSATFNMAGFTTTESDISDSGCIDSGPGNDDVSTVDMNSLPYTVVARTCFWARSGSSYYLGEIDTRLNSNKNWTYAPNNSGCSGRYDVEGILTHEFGHAFGLGDVYGSANYYATMMGSSRYCDGFQRTLGAGDLRGLRFIY